MSSDLVGMAEEAGHLAQKTISDASSKLTQQAENLQEERLQLEEEKAAWKKELEMINKQCALGDDVTLDVGGVKYRVSTRTLTNDSPRSEMLYAMFSGRHPLSEKERKTGVFFIDRNGKIFEHILEYLRVGSPAVLRFRMEPEPQRSITLYQIHEEAKYFRISDLINEIRILTAIDNLANLKQILVPHANYTIHNQHTQNPYVPAKDVSTRDYGNEDNGPKMSTTTTITFQTTYQYQRVKLTLGQQLTQYYFYDNSYFKFCDLSGVTFKLCYFGANISFAGSVMVGTVFEDCVGLVTNKIRFSEKQIRESAMDEELAEALRQAKCVHSDEPQIVTD